MADIHYNNMEVEALAKAEDISTAVNEPPQPQEERASWKLYLVSKDFFEIVGSVVFAVVALLISKYAIPLHQRPIPAQELNTGEFVVNLNYDEVFKHETISSALLIVLSLVIPLLLIILLAKLRKRVGETHAAICTYAVGFGVNALFTNVIKNYVGYLRPIFFHYCNPNNTYAACTGNSNSARVSFPSGHSSSSFCGLTLLTLYLELTMGLSSVRVWRPVTFEDGTTELVADYRKDPSVHRIISIVSLIPMFVAWFIAASRVHDNKHFPADVVGGTVIGVLVAIYTFRLWFPVRSPQAPN